MHSVIYIYNVCVGGGRGGWGVGVGVRKQVGSIDEVTNQRLH